MGNVKCRTCGMTIKKEIAVKHPTKERLYFCGKECLNQYDKKQTLLSSTNSQGNKPVFIGTNKNTDDSDKVNFRKLTDYIQQLYFELGYTNDEISWGTIGQQIKRLKNQYDYKYTGMLLTLQYYCDTLEKQITPSKGIQIPIEVFYKEAKEHYLQTKHCTELSQEFEPDKVKVVRSFQHTTNPDQHLIDLNQL